MAKVNRFYRSPERQLIDPITLQEALVIPTMMRQKHNAMAQAAAQNSVLNADTLDMDEEAARKLLDPIEAGANKIAEDLNKYGFSQERVNELIKLQAEKQRVERDSIGKLTSRKQQFQAAQQAINEKFKDDEDSRNSSLNRLKAMNKTPASFEDGKLNVPGIKSPEYYERLTTEDKTKLFKELSSILEPSAKESGYQVDTIQGLAAYQQAVSNGKVKGVTPEEYQQLFTSVMGSEVLNDFKQEAFNKGLGINEEVDQKYKKDTIQEVSDQLQRAVTEGKMSEQQALDQLKNLNQASAEDVYAQVERSKMITGVASAAGYTQNSIDTKFLNDDAKKMQYENSLMFGISPPTIPGIAMNTEILSPLYGETMERKTKNLADKTVFAFSGDREKWFKEVQDKYGVKYENNNYYNKKGEVIGFTEVQKLYDKERELLKNPYTNPKVQEFIKNNASLQSWVDSEMIKKGNTDENKKEIYAEAVDKVNNFYKKIGVNYNLGIVIPEDIEKYAKNIYRNNLDKFGIVDPEGGETTFKQIADEYKIEDLDKFYKDLKLSSSRNVFGHGNMVEASFYYDDNKKSKTIFIEAPSEIALNTEKSARIDKILTTANFKEPLNNAFIYKSDKPEEASLQNLKVQEYVVPNFLTGEVLIKVKDVESDKFVAEYNFNDLINIQDEKASKQWRKFLLKGKAN